MNKKGGAREKATKKLFPSKKSQKLRSQIQFFLTNYSSLFHNSTVFSSEK
jgi:hypothetical protein